MPRRVMKSAAVSCSGCCDSHSARAAHQVSSAASAGRPTGTEIKGAGHGFKAAGDVISLVNGRLRVSCDAGVCTNGDIQIIMDWTEQKIDSREGDAKDSITLTTRIKP